MFSPPHDLLDCRHLYFDTSHFSHTGDLADPSIVHTEYQPSVYILELFNLYEAPQSYSTKDKTKLQ
jgi:hypothetical protein